MISEALIKQLAEEKLKGSNKFIVDLKVKPANKIEVLIDGMERIAISDCVELSRHIESGLDREKEDFELLVSSAGIDAPFKVEKQYEKNAGREVSVLTKEGLKITGKLLGLENDEVSIETKRTERIEKGKGKQTITENLRLALSQVKETRLILSFK